MTGKNDFREVEKMTEQKLRQNVVDTILGWVGLNEADGSHKKIIDIYNSHKPLARGLRAEIHRRMVRRYGQRRGHRLRYYGHHAHRGRRGEDDRPL